MGAILRTCGKHYQRRWLCRLTPSRGATVEVKLMAAGAEVGAGAGAKADLKSLAAGVRMVTLLLHD